MFELKCQHCDRRVDPYWWYCPWCGQMTRTGRDAQRQEADALMEQAKERWRRRMHDR